MHLKESNLRQSSVMKWIIFQLHDLFLFYSLMPFFINYKATACTFHLFIFTIKWKVLRYITAVINYNWCRSATSLLNINLLI